MQRILVVDNYDSFTFNLVEQIRSITGLEPEVVRNTHIPLERLGEYSHLVFSPGPGIPSEAGQMMQALQRTPAHTAVLGVCLGHQGIGEVFGAQLLNLEEPLHGRASRISLKNKDQPLFRGLASSIVVGRYHSWVVSTDSVPSCLEITAMDDRGHCMAISHRTLPIFGVQFHPESVLTPQGEIIMRNFVNFTAQIQRE